MKLTSKGRYAMMAMADLAKNHVKEPISLSAISLRQGISLSFLEQLFLRLKKNDLVQSTRGPRGGYTLSRAPEEIQLWIFTKATFIISRVCTKSIICIEFFDPKINSLIFGFHLEVL